MDVTPLVPAGRQIIETYGERRFRISGRLHRGSVLVCPDRAVPWTLPDGAVVSLAAIEAIERALLGSDVEVLLIGCGVRSAPVPAEVRARLRRAGIAVESMDTGAAARTYNVLAAEGRRVAAALIATD